MVNRISYYIIIVVVILSFSSCKEEYAHYNINKKVNFYGMVSDSENVDLTTRVDKEIYPLTYDFYDQPYYISMEYMQDGEIRSSSPIPYSVPSGKQGILDSDEIDKLNWQNPTDEHNFHAWTIPWITKTPSSSDDITIGFPNPVIDGDNSQYEKFMGAAAGPFNYNDHGEYVALEFYHLVSKVVVDRMTMLYNNLDRFDVTDAIITFFEMPSTATFSPSPENGTTGASLPIVTGNFPLPEQGVSYTIKTGTAYVTGTPFYIPPEMDFSQMSYCIDLSVSALPDEYKNYGKYYGDFSSVKFIRTGPTTNNEGPSDLTILHAGEELHLTFAVSPGQSPGVGSSLRPWGMQDGQIGTSHTHPGIYTGGELNDLFNAASSGVQNLKQYYELYGSEDYTFYLYNNETLSRNFLPCYDPYVIDGQGHMITMTPLNGNIWVENVRNVYITDGKNIIFIDEDGSIFKVDPETFEMTYKGMMGEIGKNTQTKINMNTGSVEVGERSSKPPTVE